MYWDNIRRIFWNSNGRSSPIWICRCSRSARTSSRMAADDRGAGAPQQRRCGHFLRYRCLPLVHRQVVFGAIAQAQAGALFGSRVFQPQAWHPSLCWPHVHGLRKGLWEALGKPDLQTSKQHDAAEVLSALARERGIALAMPAPTATLIPGGPWATKVRSASARSMASATSSICSSHASRPTEPCRRRGGRRDAGPPAELRTLPRAGTAPGRRSPAPRRRWSAVNAAPGFHQPRQGQRTPHPHRGPARPPGLAGRAPACRMVEAPATR